MWVAKCPKNKLKKTQQWNKQRNNSGTKSGFEVPELTPDNAKNLHEKAIFKR